MDTILIHLISSGLLDSKQRQHAASVFLLKYCMQSPALQILELDSCGQPQKSLKTMMDILKRIV